MYAMTFKPETEVLLSSAPWSGKIGSWLITVI